jgi:predicted nucleotide-binding protein
MVEEYLKGAGLRVRDWQKDFDQGCIIIDEIEEAARECSRAIFLFSEDDKLLGTDDVAAPRDNVVFEAGYFMNARGRRDVLIIREGAAKMPADLGGAIYAALPSRKTTPVADMRSALEKQLSRFITGELQSRSAR